MTKGKSSKKLVRERMAKTGESYSAARSKLLIERVKIKGIVPSAGSLRVCMCGPSLSSDDSSPSCPVHGDSR